MKTVKLLSIALAFIIGLPLFTVQVSAAMGWDDLTYDVLLDNGFHDTPDKLTTSLRLDTPWNGIDITWNSSNKDVITNSGRVIRPRYDCADQNVKITASAVINDTPVTKEFEFTVLADEEFKMKDPASHAGYTDRDYMSDEDFFGVWNGFEWTTVGKFDYTIPALSKIETAAKLGDYATAKQELLNHMKTRNVEPPAAQLTGSADAYTEAEVHIAGTFTRQGTYILSILGVTGKEYTKSYASVPIDIISKGGLNTFGIMALYNEASEAYIASRRHADPKLRPELEVTVNGSVRTYTAEADTMVRTGAFAGTNYGSETELKVKTFGDFLGDETYRTIIRFNLSDIAASDNVTSARLVLNTRLGNTSAQKKDIVVIRENTHVWDESTVNYNSFLTTVHNFNGVPGGYDWQQVPGTDSEHKYNSVRFTNERAVVRAYLYTGDEKYAYYMISTIMDFIHDKGYTIDYQFQSGSAYHQGWVNSATTFQQIRGGWPRTLDAYGRTTAWMGQIDPLLRSVYMTPDVITAMMKQMWDIASSIQDKSVTAEYHAWQNSENMTLLRTAVMFPEFTRRSQWIDVGTEKWLNFILEEGGARPDGSTFTQADAYVRSTLNSRWYDFLGFMNTLGIPVNPEFAKLIPKAALYSTMLRYPNGETLQWGDSRANMITGSSHPNLAALFDDPELTYVDSRGRRGVKPEWTSKYYPDGRTAIMRSSWSDDALYMFTNAMGGGAHCDKDDNHVLVYAYDKVFLTDGGIFTYTVNNPLNVYGRSTKAHNTVEINEKDQNKTTYNFNTGDRYGWVTNNSYDFLSQSTATYRSQGFDHRRTITFVKPNFWIVSDLMTPNAANINNSNTYKQIWHMRPQANINIDRNKNTIFSNYTQGANMVIGAADKDANLMMAEGWYDIDDGDAVKTNYAYYEKTTTGAATFDTVLLPARGGMPQLNVQKIALDVPSSKATAMKFDSVYDGEVDRTYYLLDYEDNPAVYRTFEKYKTNARLALVREDTAGNVKEAILVNGNEITTASGAFIVTSTEVLEDFSFELATGNRLNIEMSQANKAGGLKIYINSKVDSVALNGRTVNFTKAGNELSLTNDCIDIPPPSDPSGNRGGISSVLIDPKKPEITEPEIPEIITPEKPVFTDIQEHWGEAYVNDLATKGIVVGSDGKFYPDNQITRAEFLAMVMRSAGIAEFPYLGYFLDVDKGDWYSGAIQGGLEAGLISPDDIFRPNDPITREEMSKIIACALQGFKEIAEIPADYTASYTDEATISVWAKPYIDFVSYHNLMKGYENGDFRPFGNATRAESAAVISRLLGVFYDK